MGLMYLKINYQKDIPKDRESTCLQPGPKHNFGCSMPMGHEGNHHACVDYDTGACVATWDDDRSTDG